MNNSLLEVIQEQIFFGFTGKINVVAGPSSQLFGQLLVKDGKIISVLYKGKLGLAGLSSLFIEGRNNKDFNYMVEPEVVLERSGDLNLDYEDCLRLAQKIDDSHKDLEKLKPNKNLRLLINGQFVISGEEIDSHEFSTLKTIIDYNKVDDIYKNTKLSDQEITQALISLRRKKALKVYS